MGQVFDWAALHQRGLEFEAENAERMRAGESLHIDGCDLPADHTGTCMTHHELLVVPALFAAELEAGNSGSLSVQARLERAMRLCEATVVPACDVALEALDAALVVGDAELLLSALRRLSSVGELARFEAEKLDGRA